MSGEVVIVSRGTLAPGEVIARRLGRRDALAAPGGQASIAASSACKAALAALTRARARADRSLRVKGFATGRRATPRDTAIMREHHGARLVQPCASASPAPGPAR